jgi:hypothetical protein
MVAGRDRYEARGRCGRSRARTVRWIGLNEHVRTDPAAAV